MPVDNSGVSTTMSKPFGWFTHVSWQLLGCQNSFRKQILRFKPIVPVLLMLSVASWLASCRGKKCCLHSVIWWAKCLHSANPWMLCTFGPTFWPLLGHFEGNTSTLEKPTIFWNGNFCARSMPENGNGFFAHGFWVFALTLGLQDTWAGMPLTLLMRLGTCWCFKTREQSKLAPQSPFYTCRLQSLGGFQLASMEWALGCQLFYSCQLTPRGFHPSWVKHLDVLLMHCEMSKISQDMSEKANFFTHASWHLGGFNHYE